MTSDRGNGGAELQLNQPVTPKTPTLNPNAKVFPGPKTTTTLSTTQIPDNDDTTWQQQDQSGRNSASPSAQVTIQGPYQLNGDVCKYTPTGTVFPTSSESPLPITHLTLSNGYSTTEMTYTPNTEGHLVSEDEMAVEESQSKADSLRAMLKYQLEYYFSRENLASDTYLRSQMDADQYVPIWTIANFNAVKRLSSDMKLIVEVLRESPYLQVDDRAEKVRPITKRCIVMLREIPDSTPIEEVKALFSGEKCPTFTGCEFAHNTNWYITFESEADAQNAYKYLREEVQTFRGKPIMARIKAKPLQSVSSKPPNGFRQPTTPTPPPPTTNIFPQQHFQYSPVSPMMNGAPQQPFAFYPNPNVMPQHPPPPQQWPTSPPYYETSLPPFPGSGISGPQNYKPSNIAGRYGYQGSRNRNPNKMTHQRTPSTPETRNVERNNNHEIIRSPHERSNTANGTQSSSPRSIREDRRDLDRENGGYRTRRDNTSPKLGQQEMHPGSLQSR
uniref:La-related protein 4-like isoform X1 n=1 Tax=Saccoglossus kowalevskii TaxID=10224 RepID=A0ABM0MYW2_SACKO|nr:PREDICTED: la-related protein 4-like isoform X1 [Saccoglossus kowalevskii]XP_006825203.1 PREDICTED: la-related protein 4-like isoform X2 [Saccoglossus kowalevskii]